MIDVKNILKHDGTIYQPIPFPEYKDVESQRKDCGKRYRVIKENYGNFRGKTLIDICCANGYFPFRFLQDGGLRAVGIEKDKDYVFFNNRMAEIQKLDFMCFETLISAMKPFDIGFYLDTHFAPNTKQYPEYLAKHTQVCFTSCARNGDKNWQDANQKYVLLLKKLFKNVEPIYQGFAGRIIYKCY